MGSMLVSILFNKNVHRKTLLRLAISALLGNVLSSMQYIIRWQVVSLTYSKSNLQVDGEYVNFLCIRRYFVKRGKKCPT